MTTTITSSSFEFSLSETSTRGSSTISYYIFFDATAINTLKIGSREFTAIYQTGLAYDYNDYNYPTNDFSLNDDSDAFLVFINNLYEKDLDNTENLDYIKITSILKKLIA